MERCRIEVGPVRPHESPDLLIENDRIERGQILKGPEELPFQNGPEINALFGAVAKRHTEYVGADDVETLDSMDGVIHGSPERSDLDWRLTRLQEIPIALKFFAMNLRPGLDEPLLGSSQAATEALDRIDGEDCSLILIVRMKMRPTVGAAYLDKHSDDDSKKPRQLRHC